MSKEILLSSTSDGGIDTLEHTGIKKTSTGLILVANTPSIGVLKDLIVNYSEKAIYSIDFKESFIAGSPAFYGSFIAEGDDSHPTAVTKVGTSIYVGFENGKIKKYNTSGVYISTIYQFGSEIQGMSLTWNSNVIYVVCSDKVYNFNLTTTVNSEVKFYEESSITWRPWFSRYFHYYTINFSEYNEGAKSVLVGGPSYKPHYAIGRETNVVKFARREGQSEYPYNYNGKARQYTLGESNFTGWILGVNSAGKAYNKSLGYDTDNIHYYMVNDGNNVKQIKWKNSNGEFIQWMTYYSGNDWNAFWLDTFGKRTVGQITGGMYIFQSETPLTFNTNQKWECNLTSAHNLTWGIDGSLQSNPCCATFFGSNSYPYFREYTGAITGIGEFSDIQSTWGNFPDLKIHGDSFSNICNAPAVSPAFVSAQIKVEQSSEVIQSFTLPSGDWRDISAN